MNKATMAEANKDFAKMTKRVEYGDAVIIEENGEDRFALVDIKEYNRLKGEVFWAMNDDGSIMKVEATEPYTFMYTVKPIGKDVYEYKQLRFPVKVLTVTEQEGTLELFLDEDEMKQMSNIDSAMSSRQAEVNISDKYVHSLTPRKDGELIDLVIIVRELLREYAEVKESNPDSIY